MTTETDPTAFVRPESLSRQAYLALREGIILGRYPQGSRLAEQRLAEELQISRVPLREAVPQLERDGFVKTYPRRGAVVETWTAKGVNDLFDLRLYLEVGAARYAARQVAAGASLAVLDEALLDSQSLVREGDAYKIAQSSTAYHEAIVELTDNELMTTLMRSVSGRMIWLFYLTSKLDADDAFHDHVTLRDAIASGNERVAESVAYAHIERDRIPSFTALEN
ncbi:GntR family transcriptional regulator [Herbiconiux liangxiaofengii]|uniref:GntR family transcriptional regulator n=1 Tax=Herbiconiux liangxiaofengii TaxID=3342795 RepID=UPI0035B991F3